MFRLFCCFALLLPLWAQAGTPIKPLHIYDGDSFMVDIDDWPEVIGKKIIVRLKGADAPNFAAKCDEEKRLAQVASNFALKFLGDAKKVELVDIERDHYFRLLAKVEADGKDLATALIEAGLAKPYEGGPIQSWCTAPKAGEAIANLGIQT